MNQSDKDLLRLATDRLSDGIDADADNREEAKDDLLMVTGEGHWPEDIRRAREEKGRPCLTSNQLPQFLRQVTGDIRRSNPAINVVPSDSDASEDMATIINGLIRNIEYQSDAASIYERAAESAAACGMGAFRIIYKLSRNDEYDAEVQSIPNPFSVVWDPMAKDPTRRDAEYCFIVENVSKENFKAAYPKATMVDVTSPDANPTKGVWLEGESVRVAEYFYKKDGKVWHCKISGADVLDEPQEYPCEYIPVVAVMGEEIHDGERVVRSGVIRYAKDDARMYNYALSTMTEVIALQPKAPFVLTQKQLEGNEGFWNAANADNLPYLVFNPDVDAPGAPQRMPPPVASQGLMAQLQIAEQNMKATTGIYNAALGERSNETSGVAIRQRQLESDISTSIYVDNLSKAIGQAGRILVSMIPRIYDTTRTIRIVGEDGATALEEINTPMQTPYGPMYVNAMDFGSYDVRVKTGPSYTTQRQESVESMLEFVRSFPQAGPAVGDLIARNMDWPGADEFADRLKKMLPPGMAEVEEPKTPEEQQAMMQSQQQALQQQQMQQAAQEAELTKITAEANEAEGDAAKAHAEAQKTTLEAQALQMNLAAQSGQMNAAIEQIVARALSAQLAQLGLIPS